MKINLSKADFVGNQALSNTQLLSLLLLGVIYNFGVGYIFEHHTDLDVKLLTDFDWLIGTRVEEYRTYAPSSLSYFLSSLTGMVLFPIVYVFITLSRYQPRAGGDDVDIGEYPPLKTTLVASGLLFLVYWVQLFAALPASGSGAARLSFILVLPVLPVISSMAIGLIGACFGLLILTFFRVFIRD